MIFQDLPTDILINIINMLDINDIKNLFIISNINIRNLIKYIQYYKKKEFFIHYKKCMKNNTSMKSMKKILSTSYFLQINHKIYSMRELYYSHNIFIDYNKKYITDIDLWSVYCNIRQCDHCKKRYNKKIHKFIKIYYSSYQYFEDVPDMHLCSNCSEYEDYYNKLVRIKFYHYYTYIWDRYRHD